MYFLLFHEVFCYLAFHTLHQQDQQGTNDLTQVVALLSAQKSIGFLTRIVKLSLQISMKVE